MFASEIMSRCVTECTEDTKVEEVFDLIRKCDHGLVVVVDSKSHRVPIGIVNERSMCEQIIAKGRNPRNLTAGSVMDSRVMKVGVGDIVEGGDGLTDISAIIVVDENRHACGLVGKDKIRELARLKAVRPESTPVVTVTNAVPVNKVREIPAFGWIQ
jgi:predicted transcriptional regulator